MHLINLYSRTNPASTLLFSYRTFNGSVDYGKKVSCTISRNGDLVSTMFLEVTLKKSSGASFYPAENFVKEVELSIGGQRIDKHYSDWFRIYDELFRTSDEKLAYRRLVDFDTPAASSETGVVKKFYVPLIFFFNKSPGLALPLIALICRAQKHRAERAEAPHSENPLGRPLLITYVRC